jgi:hypothetical protein
MKTQYLKIMALAGMTIILATAVPSIAADKDEKAGQVVGTRAWPGSEERMERMMNRLKEVDPNKAAELEKLRATNPEAFHQELREMMRERFKERMLPGDTNRLGPGPKGEMFRERLRERGDEYLEWLKANYPEESQRLAELQKDKPELYKRQLWLGARKYGRIAEAAQENPELAKVLKQDLELRNQTFDILRKIKATTDEAEKQKLTAQLEQITSERFDVILQRTQIEYDQLQEELARLQEHIKRSEAQLENWKASKAERVQERIKELLNRTEKFEWE